MANKTLYLPITVPEDNLASFVEDCAESLGWQEDYAQSAVEYIASYLRKLLLNGAVQMSAKRAGEAAAAAASEEVLAIFLAVEQEAVPPIE